MKTSYVGKINSGKFRVANDPRMWLCTGLEETTNDNGMSYRVTASFTKNPLTWDPIVTQRNSQTGQPLQLSNGDIAEAAKFLQSGAAGSIPNPLPAQPPGIPDRNPGGGIGRFPIYQAADLAALVAKIRSTSLGSLGTTTIGGAGGLSDTPQVPGTIFMDGSTIV